MQKNKFKIGYFADGPWSHLAFDLLINDPQISIEFIVPRSDTKDDTLKTYADINKIDYLFPVNINSDDFYELVQKYDCDLFVSMSFNQIFRKRIIYLPKFHTINCHAGLLPFYRGRNVLNWVLINDEKEFGITVHFVDEGIDTGDIILQKSYPISEKDNYKSLLEKAYSECANILYDAIKSIINNDFQRIDQCKIHPVGFYCGRRKKGDEVINWNQSSREIFNFSRAICFPGPMVTTFKNDAVVKINCIKLIENAISYVNTPGQILNKTKEGFIIKTKDSFVEIKEVHSDVKLNVGDKLG